MTPRWRDDQAERDLIGCAVATRQGAAFARSRVRPEQFHDPRAARAIANVCDFELDDIENTPEARIPIIARLSGVDPAWLRMCEQDRMVDLDSGGALARRVVEAARRRRAWLILENAQTHIAKGTDLDALTAALRTKDL